MPMKKNGFLIPLVCFTFLTDFAWGQTEPATSTGSNQTPAVSPSDQKPKPKPSPSAIPSEAVTHEAPATTESSRSWKTGFYLAPIEIPRPLTVGIEGRLFDTLGLSIQKSFVPRINLGTISGKFDSFEIRPRWYPFQGSFFIGVGFGTLSLAGSKTEIIASEAVEVEATITAKVITPTLGWTWGARNGGFFYGMDLGAQFTLNANTQVTSSTNSAAILALQQFIDLKSTVENRANDAIRPFTKYVFPVVGLVKIGWMF